MELNIHEIKLPGDDEFSKKFNRVSDLHAKYLETQSDSDWEIYCQAKYELEQGL